MRLALAAKVLKWTAMFDAMNTNRVAIGAAALIKSGFF
jgi:hypothetical protein